MHPYIHPSIHTSIHPSIHTYILTYLLTYIHNYVVYVISSNPHTIGAQGSRQNDRKLDIRHLTKSNPQPF